MQYKKYKNQAGMFKLLLSNNNYYYYCYTRLMVSSPGQPGQAGTRKAKPVMMGFWDGIGISS